jgi:hypothetical protein
MGVITNSPVYVSVDELFDGRTGSPWNMDGHRDYTKRYRVVVKIKEASAILVAAAPGIPQPGSRYVSGNNVEYDLLAIVTGYECRPENEGDWQNWIVEVKYSTRTPPGGKTDRSSQNNPENEPADIQWDSESLQTSPIQDMEGKPYLCSNQLPYSPPPTFDSPFPVLTISRNELSFDLNLADYYTNALNDASFLGWPKGRAQCLRPNATQKHRGTLRYWRVTYKIRFRRKYPTGNSTDPPFKTFDGVDDTWQPRILNAGLMEINPFYDPDAPESEKKNNSKWRHMIGWGGKMTATPFLLDKNGLRQTDVDGNGELIPTYKTYKEYPYANLTKLLVTGVGRPINI